MKLTSAHGKEFKVSWWRSIRLRIAAAVTCVTVMTLAPMAFFVDYWAAIQARENLRKQAQSQITAAATTFVATRTSTMGVAQSLDLAPELIRTQLTEPGKLATLYDGRFMWAAVSLPNPDSANPPNSPSGPGSADPNRPTTVNLVLRLPAETLQSERATLQFAMQSAAVPTVFLAALLGWLTASGLSRKLRRTAFETSRLDPSRPLEMSIPSGRDEVALLGNSVRAMAVRLAERVDSERRFSANVAHELRTPVTALVSASELLGDDEASSLVRRQARRMGDLVETLLELFRAESGVATPDLATKDLGQLVEDIVAQYPHPFEALQQTATNPSKVRVDVRRFERVLTNVLTNARLHGGGRCAVTVNGPTVTVRDFGEGFPQRLLDNGPQAFVRASKGVGSGLGLAIARSQCELMGAELIFTNHPDGGAQAQIRLPRA